MGFLGCQVRLLDQFKSSESYDDGAANSDFAIITLSEPVGQKTGWLGLQWAAGNEAVNLTTEGMNAQIRRALTFPILTPKFSTHSPLRMPHSL